MDIRALVKRLRLNESSLARLAGISRTTLKSWSLPERSPHHRHPSPEALRKVADGLDAFAGEVQQEAAAVRGAAAHLDRAEERGH